MIPGKMRSTTRTHPASSLSHTNRVQAMNAPPHRTTRCWTADHLRSPRPSVGIPLLSRPLETPCLDTVRSPLPCAPTTATASSCRRARQTWVNTCPTVHGGTSDIVLNCSSLNPPTRNRAAADSTSRSQPANQVRLVMKSRAPLQLRARRPCPHVDVTSKVSPDLCG
jgi:hypothetical protein